MYITKSRKIDPIFEFTVASSELSITNLHQQTGDMVGLCGTSLIRSWGKVRKWTVPDLRKTNRTRPPCWHHEKFCRLGKDDRCHSNFMETDFWLPKSMSSD